MPYYQATPFKETPKLLLSGIPAYLFGSYNDKVSPTFGYVQSNSAVTTTGTVTFLIVSGNAPNVGDKITVRGSANSTGAFNTTNATILTATTNTTTGVCTVTYAISSTTQSTTADAGQVEIPQSEIGEVVVAAASAPVAVSFATATPQQDRALTVVTSFPTFPTAAVVTLQQAVSDLDAEYATVAIVATVTGGALTAAGGQFTVDPALGKFFRVIISGLSGPASTIVCKILS